MTYVIPSEEGFKLLTLDKTVKTAYFRCTREVIGLKSLGVNEIQGVALYCAP
jgi:hypothetical protein